MVKSSARRHVFLFCLLVCVKKEQTPLPLPPEPHPLDFTADVPVFLRHTVCEACMDMKWNFHADRLVKTRNILGQPAK